ncbi:FtsX-like permease family protein [Paludisphaera rhizosphaerae]|uniref:FtsX-like permease family protein n=1 Tax=Paludisphaera rhizosphaerae TaxID=2711216 RepID=UPI0013ED628C|nr:FtsX-like permease family protein [Paludisphaera rhizosphaerae]
MAGSFLGMRNPPLAFRNVVHGGKRSLAAISGAAFSLVMVLLQLGFLQAVKITATNNFEVLDFDVLLTSKRFEQFYGPGFLPLERLRQARNVSAVESAAPLYATFVLWRCPPFPLDHPPDDTAPKPGAFARWLGGARTPRALQRRQLYAMGFDLDQIPFKSPIRDSIEANRAKLRMENRVLLNSRSHPDFGWELRDRYHDWELEDTAVSVVGGFDMLRGFAADSVVLLKADDFVRICGYDSRETTNFGLLKVKPGTIDEAVASLRQALPDDVLVTSRDDALAREVDHWVNQTSTGKLFAIGVLVAMIVAAVVVYQVLSNDVREHMPEYATLRAMGYSTLRLAGILIFQAVLYMLISFVIAVLISLMVYAATESLAGIPMVLTYRNLGLTFGLAMAVGLISGALTVNRLRLADPAELF